jgi:hypothetical protein
LDQSNFSHLRERLVEQDSARRFCDAVVRAAREANLLCNEHFTLDRTLIEAWASQKPFKSKDGPPRPGMIRAGWWISVTSGAPMIRINPPPTSKPRS